MEEVQELVGLAGRILLGCIFLRASVAKLRAPDDFRNALLNYELLPKRFLERIARWIPRLELFAALALLAGIFTPVAASLAATLLASFAGAVAVNLLRGRDIDCGCNSSTMPGRIGWTLVCSDIALVSVSLAVAVLAPTAASLDSLWRGGGASPSAAFGVAIGTSLVFIGGSRLQKQRRLRQAHERRAYLASRLPTGVRCGTAVPEFRAESANGSHIGRSDFVGRPWVAVFVSSGCPPCESLGEQLRCSLELDPEVEIVVIRDSRDVPEPENGLPFRVLYQRDGEISRAFESIRKPQAFAVNENGTVMASAFVSSVNALQDLARQAKQATDSETTRPVEVESGPTLHTEKGYRHCLTGEQTRDTARG